ncbi:FAD-I family protein [Fusobacterium pseudoperiodonticum]|uniref:FAD-I family protein n=1 Tax=Fusobacterium pseudoperiodonticum TaxID=2663009 RepID=UPI0030D0D70F
MKNKLMLTALLGLLLVGSFAYAEESDDEAKKRLLKEYEKVQKEREKEAERAAKEAEEAAKRQAEEGTQSVQDIANQAPENTEGVVATEGAVVEGGEVAVAQEEVTPKKARKDMTESEKMDLEVQRIKKRMLEINDKIENYNKTNEMLDNLEKNVGELEKRVSY